jgi:hypothetical protein
MPLARIITKSADDSLELSMQLRSRGFRVETVAPDQIPSAPADLEVCLEECAPEEVLTKAALVKESEDLWVFVAPGALDERSRPIRAIPLIPQVVEFRVPDIAAAVAQTKPQVEIPVVEVRLPVLEPEDDPILSDVEARATLAAAADSVVPKVEDLSAKATPVEAEKLVTAEPVQRKAPAQQKAEVAPVVATRSLERIKRIAVTKQVASQIPIVPERVEPKLFLERPLSVKPRIRGSRKSYKVAFRSGPKLWRTASVAFALIVLAGLVATVVAVRPPLPASRKAPATPNPAIFLPSAQASSSPQAPVSDPASSRKAIAGKVSANIPAPQNQPAAAPHRRSLADDGLIADDTVIFYDRKPVPRAAKAPPAADVKRYSDAN